MDLSEFQIGEVFTTAEGTRRWRCTDIGTRTVVAIRVDEVATKRAGEPATTRTVSGAEAEAQGYFSGPPYGVAEYVFDEDDREGCEPAV